MTVSEPLQARSHPDAHSPAADRQPPIMLLPTQPARWGPVSRRLLMRLFVVVATLQVAAALLVFVVGGDTARTAGLSIVIPGGGFLYVAWPLLFVLTAVAMVVALVLWWGVSAHFAIPLVWVVAGLAAMALVDGPRLFVERGSHWSWSIAVVYAIAVGALAALIWRVDSAHRHKMHKIPQINDYLRTAQVPERITAVRPLDDTDAELLQWCYDFAFQPDDGLDGLDWGEQFHGGTQLRYQVNSVSWAMSLYAANNLPNAPRQIENALTKVVLKHTDLRVWRYWRTLNLLGNFDSDPDPIRRDNIMFSAFLGDVINTFEAATGSARFDEPGSLTFVWSDGRTFERSTLGFFPCEPGWSFTVCNVMGAQALYGHDVAHGTDTWSQVRDRWRQTLDNEYLTPDGSYAHIRSNHVGLSWDTGEVPGGHYFANGTHRFVDILPEHARRAKALDLRSAAPKMAALSAMVVDDRLDLDLPAEPERHRTRSSRLLPWIKVIGGARLAGDQRLAEAAIRSSAEKCSTGGRWPERPLDVGAAGLGSYMLLRWSTPLDLAALNMRGYVEPQGPVLDETCWDDLLITEARSADGSSLTLALRPRDGAVHGVRLRFVSLRPGSAYRMTGTGSAISVVADGEGHADVVISVESALRLLLEPVTT